MRPDSVGLEQENKRLLQAVKDDNRELQRLTNLVEKQKLQLERYRFQVDDLAVVVAEAGVLEKFGNEGSPSSNGNSNALLDARLEIQRLEVKLERETERRRLSEQQLQSLHARLINAEDHAEAASRQVAQLNSALEDSEHDLSRARQIQTEEVGLLREQMGRIHDTQSGELASRNAEIKRMREQIAGLQIQLRDAAAGVGALTIADDALGRAGIAAPISGAGSVSRGSVSGGFQEAAKKNGMVETLQTMLEEKNMEVVNLYRLCKELRKQVTILQDDLFSKLTNEKREEVFQTLLEAKKGEIDHLYTVNAELRKKYQQLQLAQALSHTGLGSTPSSTPTSRTPSHTPPAGFSGTTHFHTSRIVPALEAPPGRGKVTPSSPTTMPVTTHEYVDRFPSVPLSTVSSKTAETKEDHRHQSQPLGLSSERKESFIFAQLAQTGHINGHANGHANTATTANTHTSTVTNTNSNLQTVSSPTRATLASRREAGLRPSGSRASTTSQTSSRSRASYVVAGSTVIGGPPTGYRRGYSTIATTTKSACGSIREGHVRAASGPRR